jgi:DNA transposition AAA+ family ATPase
VGKTYCVKTHISRQPEEIPYLECLWVWANSELEFLRALCKAVGVKSDNIPHRKAPCFEKVLSVMEAHPHRPVVLDDFHRLDRLPGHLEIVRDLTEMSGAPVVLIGEERLEFMLKEKRQVASRTKQAVEFKDNQPADVAKLAKEAAGLVLTREAVIKLHTWAKGDFRFVENAVAGCLQKAQAKGDARLDLADVDAVLRSLLAPLVETRK